MPRLHPQIEAHKPYLSLAWSAIASLNEKYFPTLADAKQVAAELAEEAFTSAMDEIPAVSSLLKLGKWLKKKDTEHKVLREKLYIAGSLNHESTESVLIKDTVSTLTKLAVPGLPLLIFIEDLHKAAKRKQKNTSCIERLISELIARESSILIITTTWPGEIEESTLAKSVLIDEKYRSKILRVRHDAPMPRVFPKGASLEELPAKVLKDIVLNYYPKTEATTLESLSKRYNNPLALELVCTLSKYQYHFQDGNLKLTSEEVADLPYSVEDLYRGLWDWLPLAAQKTLAILTLAIPDNTSSWSRDLANSALKTVKHLNEDHFTDDLLDQDAIPHGWIRVDSKSNIKTFRFNEVDQLVIAQQNVDRYFFDTVKKTFFHALASSLAEEQYRMGKKYISPTDKPEDYLDNVSPSIWLQQNHFFFTCKSKGINCVGDFQMEGEDKDVLDLSDFIKDFDPLNNKITDLLFCQELDGGSVISLNTIELDTVKQSIDLIALEGVNGIDLEEMFYSGRIIVGWAKITKKNLHAKMDQLDILRQKFKETGTWMERTRFVSALKWMATRLYKMEGPSVARAYIEEWLFMQRQLFEELPTPEARNLVGEALDWVAHIIHELKGPIAAQPYFEQLNQHKDGSQNNEAFVKLSPEDQLFQYARLGNINGIEKLISSESVDPHIIDKWGRIAADCAPDNKHAEIEAILNVERSEIYEQIDSRNIFSIIDDTWEQVNRIPECFGELSPIDGQLELDENVILFQRSLPMYDDVNIIMLKSKSWDNNLSIFYLLYEERTLFRLDGTSPPIHDINSKAKIDISEANVFFYLSFFTFFVRGNDGQFFIIESLKNPLIPACTIDFGNSLSMRSLFRKPRYFGKNDNGYYKISAMVYYSNNLFEASFVVHPTGMVEMLDDYSLLEGLPEINNLKQLRLK